MPIPHTIEVYRRVDGDGYLARFWTAGERTSMFATGDSEEAVRAKVAEHYRAAEEEIRRQEGLNDDRLAKIAAAREARKRKTEEV